MANSAPGPARVSVVVPLYNHERYVDAALQSALNQSLPATEIIVVDDGSTDGSAARAQALATRYPQIIFWSQPNQGADYTLNAGIHRATGEFVAILNSDDVYAPTRLEECVRALREQPGASAVATGLTYIDADGEEIGSAWYEDARAYYMHTQDLALSLIHANFFVTTSNLFVRRAVFDRVGYFAPLRYAHDLDFFLRLLARGHTVRFLEPSLLCYRSHGANTIEENEQRVRVERAEVLASFLLDSCRKSGARPQAWRSEFSEIAKITDRQTLSGLIDHFLGRHDVLAPRRAGRDGPARSEASDTPAGTPGTSFPGRGLDQPLANELTLAQLAERIDRHEETIATLQNGLEEKRLAFLQQEQNIAALRDELEKGRVAFRRQEESLLAMHQELGAKDAALAALGAELAAWKRTRAYRLSELWSSPTGVARKCAWTLYLLAAWCAPDALKRPLRPFLSSLRARSQQGGIAIDAVKPYQVRLAAPSVALRPKIVHAIANFLTGGSSRLVVDLIERLGDRYEQEVITSHIPSPPAYIGLRISEFRTPQHSGALAQYLQRFRPDLVHVHYWGDCDRRWYDAVFRTARECGCRIIENVNTPVEPFFDDAIAHYVYVSDYVLSHFGKRDAKGRVIHPGSNFDLFSAEREQLPQPDCIGMVYRLEGDKLNAKAIDVFIEVIKRRPGTRALIVGGGTYLEPYRAAVSAAGVTEAFTFTGYVPYDELPGLYSRMTLFVAPVWQESFGQVSPFAMSMAMPVVGYDIGALSEIIGTRELLAPPGDAKRLADIIVGLLDDPGRMLAIGRANQARARALFSVQAMIDRYAELYQQALA